MRTARAWMLGIAAMALWLSLVVGAVGVFEGLPLFTRRPVRGAQTMQPVTVQLVAHPGDAITAPEAR